MLWIQLVVVAVLALILWKQTRKSSTPIDIWRTEEEQVDLPISATLTGGADEPPRPTPGHENNAALEKDAWEDWSDELYAEASRELPVDLTIAYCDRNQRITHRDITVEKYARTTNGGVLAAYCHLRRARRPFYLSRIQFAADRTDGAAIEDLGAWLDERYEASPKGTRDRFIGDHAAALGALFFVAKADGAFRAKEKVVMRSFCASQGLNDTVVQELVIESVADWMVPSRIAFGKDLRELHTRDEPYRLALLKHAQAIVGTGKTVRDEETRAIERMRRELNLSAN